MASRHPPIYCQTIFTAGASFLAGIAAYKLYTGLQARATVEEHVVPDYYETRELLEQYLSFHYGSPSDMLISAHGPVDAEGFASRVATECLNFYAAHGPAEKGRAFDIGCAVGRTVFDLSAHFDEVGGLDFSHSFIAGCQELKLLGFMNYSIKTEGTLMVSRVAKVGSNARRDRTWFVQGDACALPAKGKFHLVSAANLICRLPDPMLFINQLADIIIPGGMLVLTTPYTWLADFTPPSKWLGGYTDASGKAVSGFEGLKRVLEKDFIFVQDKDVPFVIRETARKNQWTVAHLTAWIRRS